VPDCQSEDPHNVVPWGYDHRSVKVYAILMTSEPGAASGAITSRAISLFLKNIVIKASLHLIEKSVHYCV
jgi:hypothetical protein